MTDREAFVAAVVAQPDDDTVRLVFADWLDENGEPERAEFIRVQCELARLEADAVSGAVPCRRLDLTWQGSQGPRPPHRRYRITAEVDAAPGVVFRRGELVRLAVAEPGGHAVTVVDDAHVIEVHRQLGGRGVRLVCEGPDAPRYPHRERLAELAARERELFRSEGVSHFLPERFGASLTLRLAERYDLADPPAALLRRGFVESVTCPADAWLSHGDEIVKAQPVRFVTLTTWPAVESVVYGGFVQGYRFDGREYVHAATTTAGMLETEWPGITFALPPGIANPESDAMSAAAPPTG